MRSAATAILAVTGMALAGAQGLPQGRGAAPLPADQQQPTFRAGTIVVPIDVRVVDQNGRPVTDLEKKDFTVFEDGVAQEIAHFEATAITPSVPTLGPRRFGRPAPKSADGPTFTVVRGQGNLSMLNPFMSLDGTSGLVQDLRTPSGQLVTQVGMTRESDHATPEPVVASRDVVTPTRTPGAPTMSPDMKKTLDAIAANTRESDEVVSKLYDAIDQLKHEDGEKHIILTTKVPPTFNRSEDVDALARAAADARVVIDVAQEGACACWGLVDLERIAKLTGGTVGILTSPEKVQEKIARINSFGYQIGYYPKDATLDSRYRKITVAVNRPGVELMYRDGYYARKPPLVMDPATRRTYNRVTSALRSSVPASELKVTATAIGSEQSKQRGVSVKIHVDPDGLALVEQDGVWVGLINVAVFCGTARESVVGRAWDAVDLKLTAGQHAQFLEKGLSLDKTVTTTKSASYAKVVVYDPAADHIGSAIVSVGKK